MGAKSPSPIPGPRDSKSLFDFLDATPCSIISDLIRKIYFFQADEPHNWSVSYEVKKCLRVETEGRPGLGLRGETHFQHLSTLFEIKTLFFESNQFQLRFPTFL